ncbi:proteasome assembly chaperone 1 [Seriola lalandi dorsalis]|uniref:Proteasome assembly chaperone 1 n=1 Tax=Seriola lalandi dorsalis TaxID=1841481 RepID=A0A3B4XTM9_SERLL|nr:proteasome assembly chaperone 1 [Seriola lalandi dorsalis]XP_056253000.1 proteasome assembly chaperone 1 [Seriola aureovittata]
MATFFGEVLSAYSRAVEEDDDDDLDENEEDEQIRRELEEKREVHLHWSPEVSESLKSGNKLQCSDFILAVGHNAARFLSVYVLASANWRAVGHASVWNERSRAVTGQTSEESACVFYRHKDNPSVLICQATCYIAEDQLFQWTEKVFDCLQNRELNVTVLSDSSMADYKTADYLCTSSAPFLRALHTGTFSGQPVCQSLEQPNIITGLSAAVLNHCQVHRIATVVYQCYSDVIGPDSVTMETYKPALTKLGKSIQLVSSPSTDVLRKFVKTTDIQSNLYI